MRKLPSNVTWFVGAIHVILSEKIVEFVAFERFEEWIVIFVFFTWHAIKGTFDLAPKVVYIISTPLYYTALLQIRKITNSSDWKTWLSFMQSY